MATLKQQGDAAAMHAAGSDDLNPSKGGEASVTSTLQSSMASSWNPITSGASGGGDLMGEVTSLLRSLQVQSGQQPSLRASIAII